jgi:hypothetical protein
MKTTIKNITLISLAVLLCSLSNCKKDEIEDKPEGYVIDEITGTPVAGAEVVFIKVEGTSLLGPSKRTVVGKTISDANGWFSFSTDLGGDFLKASHPRYYDSEETHYNGNPEYRKNHAVKMVPEAFLNIHIKNVTKNYQQIDAGGKTHLYGENVDTILIGERVQSTITKISFVVRSDTAGVPKLLSKSVQPIPLDTINVLFEY